MKAKRSRKIISLLVTLAFLVTMLVPATLVSAASTYTALSVPTVTKSTAIEDRDLGTVLIRTTAGSIKAGDVVNFRLPKDFKFDWPVAPAFGDFFEVPATYLGNPNGLAGLGFDAEVIKVADNELQVRINNPGANVLTNDGAIYFYLEDVYVPSYSGDVKLTASAPGASGFSSGEVVVARVGDVGEISISVESVETFSDVHEVTLRFSENIDGAFKEDANRSLRLRLPSGFQWGNVAAGDVTFLWGDNAWLAGDVEFNANGRDMDIKVDDVSNAATYFSVVFTIEVEDETRAKYGDVNVSVSGTSRAKPTSFVIATYADMDATIKCEDPTEIIAGKTEQVIGDIVIREAARGSLVENRTVTLTLPDNAKWGKLPSVDESEVTITNMRSIGTDGKTIRFSIATASSAKAGKIVLEEAEVITAVDMKGDLVIEVGGTAGLRGEKVTVAKVVAPVTAVADGKGDVIIGMRNQPVPDFTITETEAEAIKRIGSRNLIVRAPVGVTFSAKPKVEVTEGDLDVSSGTIRLDNGDRDVVIPIRSDSSTASTIKLSDIKVSLDRTVPVGDIRFSVRGDVVNEVNNRDVLDTYYAYDAGIVSGYYVIDGTNACFERTSDGAFPAVGTAASAVVATCVTPAPGETIGTVVFTIGSTTYTVDGVEKEADVAPYIKNDRTYVSVRYVAESLGVSADNIIWNANDQSVVIIKGERIVKLVIGSTTMWINGIAFNMDTAPEIVEPGRTMLPIRWVGQALGATIDWDAATQTVTVTI